MSRLADLICFRNHHVCPRWLCFTFDNVLRRRIHKPEMIVQPYIREGDIVLDVGAGIGYFTVPMAKMVGEKGKVVALDLQESMLKGIAKRAGKAGVQEKVILRLSRAGSLEVGGKFNFILVFWVAHEIQDTRKFMSQLRNVLSSDGKILIAEPKFHVSSEQFKKVMEAARQAGLVLVGRPPISLSMSALFGKK